ncbi:hypothetical protein [Kibdelosporangium aridum]|uniref:hypothetical protein n=1 Tax=Kibdelosporangium aridum TaxID=2030 RepID=UPI000A015022|nr:hypothetical protein [Kibdelosporangium aridum]
MLGPADPVANPLTELGQLAGEVVRWKNLLAEHVAELERIRWPRSTSARRTGPCARSTWRWRLRALRNRGVVSEAGGEHDHSIT